MKKLAIAAVALFVVCLFGACSSSEPNDVDVAKLAEDLHTQITYQDDLSQISDEMFETVYKIDSSKVKKAVAYTSSGATAEEIVAIELNSADDVDDAVTALENRVAYQKAGYEDYGPAEVPKLDSAVIKSAGSYVVMCVSDDNAKAEEVIKSYLG